MTLIGIDPSLSHTAMHGPRSVGSIQTKPSAYPNAIARLMAIRDRFETWLAAQGAPGVAYIEGYAFGAKNSREALGELGGTLRLALFDLDWNVCVVPPTTLKKFVTGAGNGDKNVMLREIWRRWAYEATDDNDADAYALLQLGRAHAGVEAASKAQLETLKKLEIMEPPQ